jgi:hypothetical protein
MTSAASGNGADHMPCAQADQLVCFGFDPTRGVSARIDRQHSSHEGTGDQSIPDRFDQPLHDEVIALRPSQHAFGFGILRSADMGGKVVDCRPG